MMNKNQPKICLTVAGLDPSGGAGTLADLRAFAAFDFYAAAAITSLTFQNSAKVFGAAHQSAATVRGQIEPLFGEFEIAAVKTGMLPTPEIISALADLIVENKLKNVVVDPVIRSSSGYDLIDEKAKQFLIEKLFPVADLITPNLPEAELLTGMKIKNRADAAAAARRMLDAGAKNVLIKGGHWFEGERKKTEKALNARDFFFSSEQNEVFETEFIAADIMRGTGCALASAIAANLAQKKKLIESIRIAKDYVTQLIANSGKTIERA